MILKNKLATIGVSVSAAALLAGACSSDVSTASQSGPEPLAVEQPSGDGDPHRFLDLVRVQAANERDFRDLLDVAAQAEAVVVGRIESFERVETVHLHDPEVDQRDSDPDAEIAEVLPEDVITEGFLILNVAVEEVKHYNVPGEAPATLRVVLAKPHLTDWEDLEESLPTKARTLHLVDDTARTTGDAPGTLFVHTHDSGLVIELQSGAAIAMDTPPFDTTEITEEEFDRLGLGGGPALLAPFGFTTFAELVAAL